MAKRDPRVGRYIEKCAPFARPILKHLRKTMHGGGPLAETMKWGMPTFMYRGRIVGGIAGFKAHCALWFWRAKSIIPKSKGAMGSFGRITSVKDLPPAATIRGYAKKVIKNIERSTT